MLLSIGQVAKQAGVSVETLRFYEKQGLIAAPQRSDAGYRQYSPDTLKRMHFIQNAKQVGFTLKDIAELLALREEPGTTCADIKQRTTQKIQDVDHKILELRRIREALTRMAVKCRSRVALSECPILEELEFDADEQPRGCEYES